MKLSKKMVKEFEIRVFEESFERIKKCLFLLNEAELNEKPADNIVPIGNQVLHIIGNTRQWVCTTIGNQVDERQREEEFSSIGLCTKTDLLQKIMEVKNELSKALSQIDESKLEKMYTVQGFSVTGLSILIHVIEHTSYHTGQITLLTKLYSKQNTNYYNDEELN